MVAVLSLALAGFAYKFTVGEVLPSDDGRVEIQVNKDERNALLLEMRTWLQSSQSILAAVSDEDFAAVSKIAKAAGMVVEDATPAAMFRKIPLEMKKLGFDTRKQFDDIAADAEKLKSSKHTIAQLSAAMNSCIACHAIYRFSDAKGK